MGATLEQFDLTSRGLRRARGQVPRGARPAPPRRDRGRPHLDARGRAPRCSRPTPSRARGSSSTSGGSASTRSRSTPRRPRSRARRRAIRASSPARSGRPATCPRPTTRPSAGSPSGELVDVFAEQARGLVEGGADLIIIETAQDILEVKAAVFGAREAFKELGRELPIQTSVSLLPQGGKMLLGTDIQAVLTTLARARGRRDRAQLLDRPRGHARRDPLPRRALAAARALHPERRPAAAGPGRRDDLPRDPRADLEGARRVRRALRRLDRRRLLRDDPGPHPRARRAGRRPRARRSARSRARRRSRA